MNRLRSAAVAGFAALVAITPEAIAESVFAPPQLYSLGRANPTQVDVADVDADGWPDVVALSSQGIHLLSGSGGGVLLPARLIAESSVAPRVAKTCDIDDDGRAEILVGWEGGFLSVLRVAATAVSRVDRVLDGDLVTLHCFDADGDDAVDVVAVAAKGSAQQIRVYRGDGNGLLDEPPQTSAAPEFWVNRAAVADLDGDGAPDLALARSYTDTREGVYAMLNLGGGRFAAPRMLATGRFGVSLLAAGAVGPAPDRGNRVVTVRGSEVRTYHMYEGEFREQRFPLRDANRTFWGDGAPADFDCDGDLDIGIEMDRRDQRLRAIAIVKNQNGSFGVEDPNATLAYRYTPHGLAIQSAVVADLDRDGAPDLVTALWEGQLVITDPGVYGVGTVRGVTTPGVGGITTLRNLTSDCSPRTEAPAR